MIEQARRNAAARTVFLAEQPTASSAELGELSGSRAGTRTAFAGDWREEQRIFALSVSGQLRFPLFQFDEDGRPKPQLAPILRALRGQGLSGWELALWFAGANARLGGQTPLELLDSEPERVVAAAQLLAETPW